MQSESSNAREIAEIHLQWIPNCDKKVKVLARELLSVEFVTFRFSFRIIVITFRFAKCLFEVSVLLSRAVQSSNSSMLSAFSTMLLR